MSIRVSAGNIHYPYSLNGPIDPNSLNGPIGPNSLNGLNGPIGPVLLMPCSLNCPILLTSTEDSPISQAKRPAPKGRPQAIGVSKIRTALHYSC